MLISIRHRSALPERNTSRRWRAAMMVVINSLGGNLDDAIVMIVKHEVNEIGNKIGGRKER